MLLKRTFTCVRRTLTPSAHIKIFCSSRLRIKGTNHNSIYFLSRECRKMPYYSSQTKIVLWTVQGYIKIVKFFKILELWNAQCERLFRTLKRFEKLSNASKRTNSRVSKFFEYQKSLIIFVKVLELLHWNRLNMKAISLSRRPRVAHPGTFYISYSCKSFN